MTPGKKTSIAVALTTVAMSLWLAAPVASANPGTLDWVAGGNAPSSGSWVLVAHGDSGFAAIKFGSVDVMHSLDGATWTAGTNSTSAAWRSMTHGGGRYVAVSQGTATMHSGDGVNWTAGGNAPSSKVWHAVAHNGSRFAALSYYGSGAMYSDDSGLT